MATPRKKKTLFAAAAVLTAGVAGYYIYSAFAVQGQGVLAQAPLNVQTTVPPAFIMGVDNSGSMSSDETLCRTGQGQCAWNATTRSFFDANGVALESGDNNYVMAMDSGVPRPDHYGAARDPEFNRAYFNPHTTYLPWQKYDGTFEDNSKVTAAVEDVRSTGGTTYDFTTFRESTFRYRSGMVMAKGTTYYNNAFCNLAPGSSTIANDWVTLTEDLTFSGTCDTTFRYYPAVVYLTTTAAPPPGFMVGQGPGIDDRRILIKGAGPKGTDLYKYEYLESNFVSGGAEAVQNFANWWTYYGNRNRAMIAAMTQSMVDITNMRVGYFQINPAPPSGNVTMFDMGKAADKAELYKLMRALNSSGNTPTRRAVAYMVQQFKRTDTGAPVQLVCQKNAGMLFTDGYTNDTATPSPTVGDVDNKLPLPFGGGVASSNTIADYAMDGYLNNLRGDLKEGLVPVPKAACGVPDPDPRLDCQTNLHMNFYGITLGARGAIYDVDANATADPYKYPPSWGATGTMNLDPRNVDDIWHAAINSRGEFINASSPAAVTAAMRRILQQVGAGATPSGSIGLTGARVGAGSLTVEPFYESTNSGTDWYSTLTGAEVSKDDKTGAVVYKNIWEASIKLPAPAERSKTTWFATTSGNVVPTVKQFSVANLGTAPFETLCSNAAFSRCTETKINTQLKVSADQAVNYLLGDQSLQVKNNQTVKLRDRTTPLGDIVNSSPVISTPSMDDYGYISLRGTTPGSFDPYDYTGYLKTKKDQNRASMVYVGANDGMLHAFDGKTGIERFAYIPTTALGHMGNLLFPYRVDDKNDQTFSHRYYVDGPITVSDARIGSSWKTVLVGTAGAGGRSVFALNVSSPTGFDAGDVLWELNDQATNAEIKDNIGYVLGKPVIVPVKVGTTVKWKAIFGNGYGSKSGLATLFVVDMETGAVETRVATETGGPSTSNGLGNIIVVDRWLGSSTDAGRDGYADTVYAGDQNGAVWKFDLRTDKPTIAVGGKPLFVAMDGSGNRQPILGGFEAASGPAGGVMLYFGTGSFSFENDGSDKTMQSVYGVLDNFSTTPVGGRSALLEQRIMLDGAAVRTVTKNTGLGKMGWFMDLGVYGTSDEPLAEGERFVGNPVIANGIVFFPTYDPNSTVECGTSGNNWLYGLNALTGGAALNGVRVGKPDGDSYDSATGAVKLDTKGTAPIKDVAVMATPRQGILPLGTDPAEALKAQCSMVVQVAGASPLYLPRPCGRQSWRQVL